ncbi:MAG: hypothetical protein IAE77_05790 [Prosthecobacter sp.]|jgi:hypothetical protein|uniref:hypothetical protein n=1 Tax=Prosthecobacter sp. TaxID=1965333 RepID=UPI0019FD15EF|nr:hypothetical protein [Prosthecobacter sp.]MBE2282955.1 hypothetical protein [Prosthecobacter sp.]
MKLSPNQFKNAARGVSTDMSAEAISRRVKIMDRLWQTGRRMKAIRTTQPLVSR